MTTPRERRRAATTARIKDLALTQLASGGPAEISLRQVARDLDMVSSALYRYYPSRDALVTDLLLDAYTDLAAHLREAVDGGPSGACAALRTWALAAPHRFALLYGSPIPGYRAPEETVPAAAAVFVAFARAVAPATGRAPAATGEVADRLRTLVALAELDDVGPQVVDLAIGLFALTVGVVVLELNGQLVGTFEPAEGLLVHLVAGAVADDGA